MKKLIFSCLFLVGGFVAMNAQCSKDATASKSCCSSKTSTAAKTDVKDNSIVADAVEIAAAADASIQKRQNPESGEMSYFQKSVCSESGKVSWNEVKFDETTKKFTQVASVMMEKTSEGPKEVKKSACCSKEEAKACCSSKKESGTK
ncbi:MAG TPA: hypothetical protein PKD85_04285 [Saprospiraceae bacterium]|nr:hypothetical protein [Saprospiraceae bacterium]